MSDSFNKRILFVGIPDMAYVCLDGLVKSGVNIVGVVGAKKDHPTYWGFKNFVKNYNLNFIEYDNLDDIYFINKIKELKADLAVVCSFNYKVPKVFIEALKDGFINVHPSLLPQYRGPNPYSAVILNNEQETGVTLHFMDEKFDTGDIVLQKKIPISQNETMGTLFNKLNIVGLDMLLEMLKTYEKGALPRRNQPEGDFKKGKLLDEKSLTIDYNKTAFETECLIRALNPFVLARTSFRGALTKVLTAEILNEDVPSEILPGTIVKIENDKFYIKTGKGLLAITSMQFGSFFAGTSKEFIQILNPKVGEKFE